LGDGSKRVKSGKDVPSGGFIKNNHPTPSSPKIPKILHYKSRFSPQHWDWGQTEFTNRILTLRLVIDYYVLSRMLLAL